MRDSNSTRRLLHVALLAILLAPAVARVPLTLHKPHRSLLRKTQEDWQKLAQVWSKFGSRWQEPCPAWIQEYASWPARIRRDKILVHMCGLDPDTGGGICTGTGDRIRGMQEMVRFGYYSNRTVVFHWEQPMPLETFFEPASELDWRAKPEYNIKVEPTEAEEEHFWGQEHPSMHDGSFRDWPDFKIQTSTNMHSDELMTRAVSKGLEEQGMPPHLGDRLSLERSCIFNAFFRPTQLLQEAIFAQRSLLFGDATTEYVAVHLRMGGFKGERMIHKGRWEMYGWDQMTQVAGAVMCAKRIAMSLGIRAPVLVITDNHALRTLLGNGHMKGVVGPRTMTRYVAAAPLDDESSNASRDELLALHMPAFVDMGLIAFSRCAIISDDSGFGATAVEWGRPNCVVTVEDCVRQVDALHYR